MTSALDLISTPVGVLNATPLETRVGLSGDDPLCERFSGDRFRVFLSIFDPEGRFVKRAELDPIGPGERRMLDLSALARSQFGDRNVLTIIHRVPSSLCPPGQDPQQTQLDDASYSDFDLLRTMVEYGIPGRGRGGVIYETPPGINDPNRRHRQTALILSSKIAVSKKQDTSILLLNTSVDFAYERSITVRMRLFGADGGELAAKQFEIAPFAVNMTSVRDWLSQAGREVGDDMVTYSIVGWSRDGALIPLFLQTHDEIGSVSIEHSNPPQVYLLPVSQALRFQLKEAAVMNWDRTWTGAA